MMNNNLQAQGIRLPFYFLPEKIAEDEEFKFINDMTLENIIPNRYMISNYGRVWDTYTNRLVSENYDKKGTKNDGTPKGYLYSKLQYRRQDGTTDPNGGKRIRINRAVAITFNPVENYKNLEVNHIDGDHSNNTIKNLEWSTTKDNRKHAMENRLNASGENAANALFTNEQVEEICKLIMDGYSNKEIVKIMNLNVDDKRISNIRCKSSYKYITEKYNFPGKENSTPKNSIPETHDDSYIIPTYLNPLDQDKVIQICEELMKQEKPYVEIAKEFNIPVSIVQNIHSKKTYKPITSQYNFPPTIRFGELTENEVKDICERLQKGESYKQISKATSVPTEKISSIYHRRTYKNISKDYNW